MSWALICTGQGAQDASLFRKVTFSPEAEQLKQQVLGQSVLPEDVAAWLLNPDSDPTAITRNHFSQPLLCLYQQMLWKSLNLPTPSFFAGYSLGELSTYGCAGAFTAVDVVSLAVQRAEAMDAAGMGEMVAVKNCPVEMVEGVAREHGGFTAIVLCAQHAVFGFPKGKADAFMAALPGAAQGVKLPVTVPSHTPLLEAAAAPFAALLEKTVWQTPSVPILAGINGAKVLRRENMLKTLPAQIHQTIRWDRVVARMIESRCRVFLEIGPGSQLARAIHDQYPEVQARSVDEFHTLEGVRSWLEKCLAREC